MKKAAFLITLAALAMNGLRADFARAEGTYGEASDLFTIGAGARSMAMGGAFTAVADDASAPYFNPAGLAYLDEHQLMVMHAPMFFDSSYNYLSSAHPFGDKWGSLALSDSMIMSRNLETRDRFNRVNGGGSFQNSAIFASYSRKLIQKLSVGINAKFIEQKLVGFSGSDLGVDVGFLYKPYSFLNVGASFANINSPEVTLQREADVYRAISRFGVAADVFRGRLTLAADMIRSGREDNLYAAGIEYTPTRLFTFRGGFNDNRSYTFGVGVNVKPFRVDYALSNTDLGAFNKVSITWAWHNIYKTDIEPPLKEGRAIFPLSGFENKVVFHSNVPDQFVSKWSLQLKDKDGKEVRTLGADLRPPKEIVWDAKNAIGEPVVDGKYQFTFQVDYKNGKSWTLIGDLNLALPDTKLGQGATMNLELNGAKASEQPVAEAKQAVTLEDAAGNSSLIKATENSAPLQEGQSTDEAQKEPAQ